ncbi:MAG: Z1 domain-containing protein [Hyphomicrobium sp.]|nr:Z1 domain-containing protein [Hyphomicrobium sp.]
MSKPLGFYDRLGLLRAAQNQPDTAEYNACVRETVDELVSRETSSSHPGMLLGKIQSGKTRAFLGIIALAFDKGFDVAVVLTKGTKTLSNQTVARISRDFQPFREDNALQVFDILRMPTLTQWELEQQKLVIVAKKEHNNMRRLIELFTKTHPEFRSKRVLIVDDEADFASIRFSKKKGSDDINQGKIANQMDELRRELARPSFLQVTATPYALYLQPDEYEKPSGANMTFEPKRPAFTKIVPVHSAYVGGDRYFGDHDQDRPEYYLWHPVEQDELEALKKEDKRRFNIDDVLTTPKVKALRSAIANFVTAGAIRRLHQAAAGERPKHYAMIVHVETARSAHNWQHRVTQAVLDQMKDAIITQRSIAGQLIDQAIADLRRSIEAEGLSVPDRDALVKEIRESFEKGAVATEKVNSDNAVEALLDENAELKLRTPYNVFIGGQILDRGITVPNLLGFYYGRSPKKMQQDTVLQHARMYGARPRPDLAVTRLYTTASNHAALKRIHEFDTALREAFMKGAHDRGVAFILKDVSGKVSPCAPSKVLMSDITPLRPGRAFLPVGFQTKAKSTISKTVEKIDRMVPAAATECPLKIKTGAAIEIVELIKSTLEDNEIDPFDWKAMRGAIEYYSRIAAPDKDRGNCWLLAATERDLVRVREGGRFSNAPHTKQQEAIVANMGDKLPILMLFRQNGSMAKGWRDAPFWWPVLFPPASSAPAVFANSVPDDAPTEPNEDLD